MNKASTKAIAAEAKGTVKETIGKITGDAAKIDGVARESAAQPRKILGLAKACTALDDRASLFA
jgi:uncharacterized protein YjbJ (UPF0337 family)